MSQARQTRITSSLAAEGFEGIAERPISSHLVMLVGFLCNAQKVLTGVKYTVPRILWKNKEWKCRQVCIPSKGGTLKPYQEYGDDLVCVRYRYDDNGFRIKTVELVIDVAKIK